VFTFIAMVTAGKAPFQMGESSKSVNEAIIFAKGYNLHKRNIQINLQMKLSLSTFFSRTR